jgi:hypothetical protein
MRYVSAFGRFWFDFLIGDRPEFFFGAIAALAMAAGATALGWTTLNGLLLFGLVVATGALGLTREVAAVRVRRDR